jgi:hypothetical protein
MNFVVFFNFRLELYIHEYRVFIKKFDVISFSKFDQFFRNYKVFLIKVGKICKGGNTNKADKTNVLVFKNIKHCFSSSKKRRMIVFSKVYESVNYIYESRLRNVYMVMIVDTPEGDYGPFIDKVTPEYILDFIALAIKSQCDESQEESQEESQKESQKESKEEQMFSECKEELNEDLKEFKEQYNQIDRFVDEPYLLINNFGRIHELSRNELSSIFKTSFFKNFDIAKFSKFRR